MEEFCAVIIKSINGMVSGHISGLENNIFFNPLNILPELRYKPYEIDQNDLFFDVWDYEYEYAFEHSIKVDNRDQYTALVTAIKKIISARCSDSKKLDFSEIEILKAYFDINVQFTPYVLVKNSSTPFIQYSGEFHKRPIHYSSFSIDNALKFKPTDYFEYFYQCYSLSDAIFSILHFLALNEYKFKQCQHCGRYFATKIKQDYCSRNSTYPNRERYSCKEAVKRIRQDIQRSHRRIYENLYANYLPARLDEFETAYNKALEEVKSHSDYSSIDNCYQKLSSEQWYTKEAIRNVGVKEKK